MSADVINANIEPPVWEVHGANWQVEIPLDKYNAQFTNEMQAYEAASRALMVFKGHSKDLFLILEDGENIPYLGESMIVHLKGASPIDPNASIICFTHEVLANQGFYAEATKMARVFIEKVEALEKAAAANPDAVASLRAAVKDLLPRPKRSKKTQKKVKFKKNVPNNTLDGPDVPPV